MVDIQGGVNFITGFFGNQYLSALAIILIFFLLTKLLIFLLKTLASKVLSKTQNELDDDILKKSNRPLSTLLFLFGVQIALSVLVNIPYEDLISKILSSFILFTAAFLISDVINVIISHWGKAHALRKELRFDEQFVIITKRMVTFILLLIMVIFILRKWDVAIGPLVASLGVVGIAVAFALQSTLANILGGFSMMMDKTLKVGDFIKVGSDPNTGASGTVLDIGLRSTKIRTVNNEEITVPNGRISNEIVVNSARPDLSARVEVNFSVSYGVDAEKVKKLALGALKKVDKAMKKPEPEVYFVEMNDFAMKFKLFFWVGSYTYSFASKEKANIEIYNSLKKAKIKFPSLIR